MTSVNGVGVSSKETYIETKTDLLTATSVGNR